MLELKKMEDTEIIQLIKEGNEELFSRLSMQGDIHNLIWEGSVLNNKDKTATLSKRLINELDIDIQKENNRAHIYALMDTSGSMGIFEKHVGRSLITSIRGILELFYHDVSITFISHHTDARQVTEQEFYTTCEQGGTIASSAYKMANERLISTKGVDSDNYVFHISDGDNLTSDNFRCVNYLEEVAYKSIKTCYLEVNQYNRSSTLMREFKNINIPNFKKVVIRDKNDICEAISKIFSA